MAGIFPIESSSSLDDVQLNAAMPVMAAEDQCTHVLRAFVRVDDCESTK